jgi:broad specificity phosphatase PhoE
MLKVIIIQPGATDFDEQRRIKGCLDLPLNARGRQQVSRTCFELAEAHISHVYSAPCQSALETADVLAREHPVKVTPLEQLRNLDHGLWHGKLIEEVKRQQPRVYRMWQEGQENVCPPEGETWLEARERVTGALRKILKKHKEGVVALVIPEPVATLVRSLLCHCEPGDLWKAECDCGRWEVLTVEPAEATAVMAR